MTPKGAGGPGRAPASAALALAGLTVAAALAAMLLPATAVGKGKPNLRVSAISSPPATVEVGDRFRLQGTVTNRGRRGARPPLKLIVPDRPGATKGKRMARKRAARVRPKGKRRFGLRAVVPPALGRDAPPEGRDYRLAACVRKRGPGSRFRCRTLRRPLRVLPDGYRPGARTIGDPLFPQVGNGGYDVADYEIELVYTPSTNRLGPGTRTTITATATQNLSELSLDFQGLDVESVQVDGEPAGFEQVLAKPPLEGDPETTQLRKLVVTPAAGIDEGSEFAVEVAYQGEPQEIIDPDGSSEGWVRVCAVPGPMPLGCRGSFVVNEPNGAQSWFPNNNHPTDKATFTTSITAPSTHAAIGIGELEASTANGDGTTTWTWSEEHPTATYLTTATVGEHDYSVSTVEEAATGRSLPDHRAITTLAVGPVRDNIDTALNRTEEMIDFLGSDFGPYPFNSTGAVVDAVPTLGYALEVQTRPHFSSLTVSHNTLLHEHAHHWFGNSVSPATWLEIWHNEGWAEWSTWYWAHAANGSSTSPADRFQSNYDSASDEDWSIPPATLNGDPANLFEFFPVYVRSAMTLEGYRQIVGDETFFSFGRELLERHGYSHVSTAEVIALAEELSGLEGAQLDLLGEYFEQWLYGNVKPTILPADFGA